MGLEERGKHMHLIKNVLTKDMCNAAADKMNRLAWQNKAFSYGYGPRDVQITKSGTVSFMNIFQNLHFRLTKHMEELYGKRLWPTTNFHRIYAHGSTLKKHIDAPHCEYSMSINFRNDPEYKKQDGVLTETKNSWGFRMASKLEGGISTEMVSNDIYEVTGKKYPTIYEHFMEQGDGVTYLGMDYEHERLELEFHRCYQGFFHWVNRDGAFNHMGTHNYKEQMEEMNPDSVQDEKKNAKRDPDRFDHFNTEQIIDKFWSGKNRVMHGPNNRDPEKEGKKKPASLVVGGLKLPPETLARTRQLGGFGYDSADLVAGQSWPMREVTLRHTPNDSVVKGGYSGSLVDSADAFRPAAWVSSDSGTSFKMLDVLAMINEEPGAGKFDPVTQDMLKLGLKRIRQRRIPEHWPPYEEWPNVVKDAREVGWVPRFDYDSTRGWSVLESLAQDSNGTDVSRVFVRNLGIRNARHKHLIGLSTQAVTMGDSDYPHLKKAIEEGYAYVDELNKTTLDSDQLI